MKRIITSLLVVVLMFGVVGLAAFADTYSDTYNVANTFFNTYYTVQVPDLTYPVEMRVTGGYDPGTELRYDAYAYTNVALDYIQEEYANAYVMICGDGIVRAGALATYEVRDCEASGENVDGGDVVYDVMASVICTNSRYAVKVFHSGSYGDFNGSYYNTLESTYVCPKYYELFGNE